MENPLHAIEALPKNQKIMVIGGAAGLGLLLVVHSRNKKAAADNASASDPSATSTTGTADSGVSGYDPQASNSDAFMNDEGIIPYSTAGASGADPYYGGIGYTNPGATNPTTPGAGDIASSTATAPGPQGDPVADAELGAIAGLLAANAGTVTGGGAPHTDATKHMVHRAARHTGHRTPTKASPHSTTHRTSETTSHKTETKPRRASRPKPRRRRHR